MHVDCPFCLSNNLLTAPILAESEGAFAIAAARFPDCFLIVPKQHAESVTDLPDDWWAHVKAIFASLGELADYNISLNIGTAAGQTLKHLHFWIVPRKADEPASGKGLATLVSLVNESPQPAHA